MPSKFPADIEKYRILKISRMNSPATKTSSESLGQRRYYYNQKPLQPSVSDHLSSSEPNIDEPKDSDQMTDNHIEGKSISNMYSDSATYMAASSVGDASVVNKGKSDYHNHLRIVNH